MSALQQPVDRSDPARTGDEGRAAVPPTPMQVVPTEADHLSADDPGNGSADGGGDGAGDPAFDFFRQDAIRQGYVGPRGFAEYLRKYGIISDRRLSRISEVEITGLDLDAPFG